jgi:hypothetical protein
MRSWEETTFHSWDARIYDFWISASVGVFEKVDESLKFKSN